MQEKILNYDTGMPVKVSNAERRYRKWAALPAPLRYLVAIIFHPCNEIWGWVEDNFAGVCPYCGGQYFDKSEVGQCCAEWKKKRGPNPGVCWNSGTGSGGGYSSGVYDRVSPSAIKDESGRTYERR